MVIGLVAAEAVLVVVAAQTVKGAGLAGEITGMPVLARRAGGVAHSLASEVVVGTARVAQEQG